MTMPESNGSVMERSPVGQSYLGVAQQYLTDIAQLMPNMGPAKIVEVSTGVDSLLVLPFDWASRSKDFSMPARETFSDSQIDEFNNGVLADAFSLTLLQAVKHSVFTVAHAKIAEEPPFKRSLVDAQYDRLLETYIAESLKRADRGQFYSDTTQQIFEQLTHLTAAYGSGLVGYLSVKSDKLVIGHDRSAEAGDSRRAQAFVDLAHAAHGQTGLNKLYIPESAPIERDGVKPILLPKDGKVNLAMLRSRRGTALAGATAAAGIVAATMMPAAATTQGKSPNISSDQHNHNSTSARGNAGNHDRTSVTDKSGHQPNKKQPTGSDVIPDNHPTDSDVIPSNQLVQVDTPATNVAMPNHAPAHEAPKMLTDPGTTTSVAARVLRHGIGRRALASEQAALVADTQTTASVPEAMISKPDMTSAVQPALTADATPQQLAASGDVHATMVAIRKSIDERSQQSAANTSGTTVTAGSGTTATTDSGETIHMSTVAESTPINPATTSSTKESVVSPNALLQAGVNDHMNKLQEKLQSAQAATPKQQTAFNLARAYITLGLQDPSTLTEGISESDKEVISDSLKPEAQNAIDDQGVILKKIFSSNEDGNFSGYTEQQQDILSNLVAAAQFIVMSPAEQRRAIFLANKETFKREKIDPNKDTASPEAKNLSKAQEAAAEKAYRAEVHLMVHQVNSKPGHKFTAMDPDKLADINLALDKEFNDPDIDAAFVLSQQFHESALDPHAVSYVGAKGISQFMDGTFKMYGQGDPFNPQDDIRAQFKYMIHLRNLMKQRFPHMSRSKILALTLSGYNAGEYNHTIERGVVLHATLGYVNEIKDTKAIIDGKVSHAIAAVPGSSSVHKHKTSHPTGETTTNASAAIRAKQKCDLLGVKFLGKADGYAQGVRHTIYLCELPQSMWNDNIPRQINVDAAQQVMSIVSGMQAQGYNVRVGSDYRTQKEQIGLRKSNGCPDIYHASSSACRIPTARPGWSNHQMGEAVDLTFDYKLITSRNSVMYQKLIEQVTKAHWKNYSEEPWHMSYNGK